MSATPAVACGTNTLSSPSPRPSQNRSTSRVTSMVSAFLVRMVISVLSTSSACPLWDGRQDVCPAAPSILSGIRSARGRDLAPDAERVLRSGVGESSDRRIRAGAPRGLGALTAGHVDLVGLARLGEGDCEVEHSVRVLGLRALAVEPLPEDELAAETSLRTLRDDDLTIGRRAVTAEGGLSLS